MNDRTLKNQIDLLRNLRAVRSFTAEPVPPDALHDILDIVRLSGSAKNEQPWDLVVIKERSTLARLANFEGYVGHLAGAALAIALVMDVTNDEYATFDEGRLAERVMLTAAAYGLGSCIGWFEGSGRTDAHALLNAPANSIVRTIISIGFPAPADSPQKSKADRKPLASFVHDERFSN